MKCKECGHELEPPKTIKVKELGIEVEVDVHDKGKTLSEIHIPKGWRLLTINEVIWLANSKHAKVLKMELSNSKDDFFFEQPFDCNRKKILVAGFGTYLNGAYLDCSGDSLSPCSVLGIRFCRELKK